MGRGNPYLYKEQHSSDNLGQGSGANYVRGEVKQHSSDNLGHCMVSGANNVRGEVKRVILIPLEMLKILI